MKVWSLIGIPSQDDHDFAGKRPLKIDCRDMGNSWRVNDAFIWAANASILERFCTAASLITTVEDDWHDDTERTK